MHVALQKRLLRLKHVLLFASGRTAALVQGTIASASANGPQPLHHGRLTLMLLNNNLSILWPEINAQHLLV